MNRINKILALIHIIPWAVALVILFGCVLIEDEPFRPKAYLIGLYVFYAHLFIFKKYLNKRKYKPYFLYLIGIFLTGSFPFLIFAYFIKQEIRVWVDLLVYYGDSIPIVFTFIIFSSLVVILQNLIINTFKKEQLEKQVINTELVYLKSQINPHFLFNTLNNIHTLVYTQDPAAPEAMMRLSSLMRYMIYESNALTVPLSIEINYLQDYISLQQLRYKATPIVDYQVEGNTETCHIAPLLFIHLLENAYKHSPSRLRPGSIKVSVAVKGNQLIAIFQNPIGNRRANILEEPGGIGLLNVQKRLQLLYPDRHRLDINKTDEVFTVELKIANFQKQVNEKKPQLLYN
ncbi:sensor histidine kinase [Pontibacter cellulosilyticus]|uniref:Histidine kinase n=1 Tax=Pontibacter cellulosilyticus TaxID=1720253 RepID=A0A923N472_9BACT|nr:histidine kinase [Pontibacter cellulosilyticus]MBC5991864.1 histidine kinase [Pontibacter cellulosilyticus]